MKTVLTPAGRIAIVAALLAWGTVSFLPPKRLDPLPATSPADQFSAERAIVHVEAIAQRPHPAGSPDNDRVRNYIREKLTRLGIASELQTGTATQDRTPGRKRVSVPITNVIARVAGVASSRPAMLVAHYDSVYEGPGAADDASGVAVLLEVARVLRNRHPLRNDVIFLFTDGEEGLMLGAQQFLRDHRWARQPGVILNFDAAASGGKPLVVESSNADAWLVRGLHAEARDLDGSSLLTSVLPALHLVVTDLTPMRAAGLVGMSIGFASDPNLRHAAGDVPAILDRASVQELGTYALAGVGRFADADLNQPHPGDAVYFGTPAGLVEYRSSWAAPLAGIAVIGFVAATWAGIRRRARGVWMAVPLGLLAVLQLAIAVRLPGASPVLTWPVLAAVISFAVLLTAPARLGAGWRLGVLLICPAAVFVILAPLLRFTNALIPMRFFIYWAVPVATMSVLIVMTSLPQLVLLLRRVPVQTPAARASAAAS